MFQLKLLTKYRTELMGIAMLMIILYHSKGYFDIPFLDTIKGIGYAGVDIFLFLSGLGLYFSLVKDEGLKDFYKRRFIRIVPYYLPIVFLFTLALVLKYNYSTFIILTNITGLAFFIEALYPNYYFDWYIPSLLILYLVAPFYYRAFGKRPELYTILISLFAIILSIIIALYISNLYYLLVFTVRIPIFFIGLLIGKYIKEDKQINKKALFILFIFFVIGGIWLWYNIFEFSWFFLFGTGLYWYPFILITLPLLLILSSCLEAIGQQKYSSLIFFGQYTLPIYLIHERCLYVLLRTVSSTFLVNIIGFILTLILAYFYQNIISSIMKKYNFLLATFISVS